MECTYDFYKDFDVRKEKQYLFDIIPSGSTQRETKQKLFY